MSIDENTLANSELVYGIIRELSESEKTPTQLSESLGTSSQSINNYLKKLNEVGIVEKEKRDGRSRPYSLNGDETKEFVVDYFQHIVESEILEEDISEEIANLEVQLYDYFAPYKLTDGLGSDLEVLLMEFLETYIRVNETSTIREMLDIFLDGIEMVDLQRFSKGPLNETPTWLYALKAISKRRHDYTKDPESLVRQSITEYQKYPDTIEKRHKYILHSETEDQFKEVDSESVVVCPECGEELREKLDGECPHCGENIDSRSDLEKEVFYICPECGEELEDPEHNKMSSCGCGTLLNEAERKREVQEFESDS